jgi:hypothetical protein
MTNAKWNLLVYANEDDVVLSSRMQAEIAAMRNIALPPDCHIAVQFNTAVKRELHLISNGQYSMIPGTRVDTSQAAALTNFIKTATDKLGRRPTILVLAAHGSGLDEIAVYVRRLELGGHPPRIPALFHILREAMRWGPDPYNGQFLTNDEIRSAIANSPLGKVDVLAFNACWMGMLEIAYEMREVADTFVACQVVAKLWPYGDMVARLAADKTQASEGWAAAIVDAVRAEITGGSRKDALSAFRTGQLDVLADAVSKYADRAMLLIDTKWAAMSNAINNSPRGVDNPLAADLALIVNATTCGDQQAEQKAAKVATALAAARIANVSHSSHPGVQGMSIFCPADVTINVDAAYANLKFRDNHWKAFLKKFQIRQAAELGLGLHVLHPPHPVQ